nr:pyrokinin-1 receptor-like [Rhipicephalus microplus]
MNVQDQCAVNKAHAMVLVVRPQRGDVVPAFNVSENITPLHDGGWPDELDEEFSENFVRAVTVLGYLYTFFIPMLIVLGLVGNGLSFVTFLFTRLKVRASSFYLGTLALSDFGYLFLMAFVWLDKQGVKMLNKRGMCQGILYLSTAFSFWSVWLTVTFTAERCFAVQCPLWRLQLSTTCRARITVGVTAAASLLLNSYLLLLTDVIVEDGVSACHHRPEFKQILHYTNIMDTVVTLVVPFILIVIMNFMIGRALYLFNTRRRLQRIGRAQMNSADADNRNTLSGCSSSASNKAIPTTVSANGCTQLQHQYPERLLTSPSQISVSRMLFLVCTVFIILNLPSYVVRIHVFVLSVSNQPVPDYILLLQRYFMLLYYTNFAVNFILYNLGSRIFRRVMKQFVASKWSAVRSLCRPTEAYDSSTGAGDAVTGSPKPRQNKEAHHAAGRHQAPRKT